jgi:hypothetical protein
VGGLEETLKVLPKHTTLPTPAFVIISDFEEEKHVESIIIKKDEQVQ